MRIFVAGATGVLGRALVRQLRTRAHDVIALARSDQNEILLHELGAIPRRGDLFDADSLARAAEGCAVVIHAATAIPTSRKYNPQDWQRNDRIRREGTRALAQAAAKAGAKAFLLQGITWVAQQPDGSAFNEDSPLHTDWVTRSMADGEEIAIEAGQQHGFRVGILRLGAFYGPEAAHTRLFGEMLRKRQLPVIGNGLALWSLIHTEDAAGAFVAAAESPRAGLWHVVDNQPVSVGIFLEEFARQLGAPHPRHVPVWLARLLAGKETVQYMTASRPTSNARFCREFGWAPRYPTYREGIAQVAAAWNQR